MAVDNLLVRMLSPGSDLYAHLQIIVLGHVLDENHTQEKKEEIPTTSHLGISKIV